MCPARGNGLATPGAQPNRVAADNPEVPQQNSQLISLEGSLFMRSSSLALRVPVPAGPTPWLQVGLLAQQAYFTCTSMGFGVIAGALGTVTSRTPSL